jgi:copper(I)-binding protein
MRDNPLPRAPRPRPPVGPQPSWAAVIVLAATLAVASPDAQALFIVNQPWVKPGTRATEAYMILTSTDGATLIGVRSPIAAQAVLRGPQSRGQPLASLPLPAGSAIALRPNAERVALTGLARALKLGERVPLTLVIETSAGRREEIAVDAEVRAESPLDAERAHHHH